MRVPFFVLPLLLAAFLCTLPAPGSAQADPPPSEAFMKKIRPDMRDKMRTDPLIDVTSAAGFAQQRASLDMANAPNLPVHPDVKVSTRFIPGPDGKNTLRVRVYEPRQATGPVPGVLWLHGGGMIAGTPEIDEKKSQHFVTDVPCVVVAPDYRLAPEFPYPAALDDCYASLQWFADNAPALGVDPQRIAVAGLSAGGNLTAALALLARDKKGPHIAFQMPLYPMLDDRFITPSSQEIYDPRVWHAEANAVSWNAYLGKNRNAVTPYMAPARATDLRGLPPTYTCVGALDIFRDETIDYVARLARQGVPVELHIYPAVTHSFENSFSDIAISKAAEQEYINAVKKALQPE